jgi:hypothetical protein
MNLSGLEAVASVENDRRVYRLGSCRRLGSLRVCIAVLAVKSNNFVIITKQFSTIPKDSKRTQSLVVNPLNLFRDFRYVEK